MSEVGLVASNTRVVLIPPVPEDPFEVVTDSDGCFSFSTGWVWGHKLLVYADAFHGDSQNVRISAFDTWADMEAGNLKAPWEVDLHHMGDDALAIVTVDMKEDDHAGRIFAWANWVVARLEDELDPGLSGQKVLRLVSGFGTPYDNNYGIATPDTIWLAPSHTSKKFIVAHEVGHWLEHNWIAQGVSPSYQYSTQDPKCYFKALGSNSLHGIRSAEFGNAALAEGFAHYIATWAFDDPNSSDAIFKYYKEIDDEEESYVEFKENGQLVSALGGSCNPTYVDYPESCPQEGFVLGGDSAWVERECPTDWSYPDNAVSSELDWLRLFWQLTSPDVSAPTPTGSMHELLQLLDLTNIGAMEWKHLNAEVGDPANVGVHDLAARFDYLTTRNGVNNGNG